MERLESYVAGGLLQRIRRAAGNDQTAASVSFRGATLFVDISGYTRLAEALCSQGPAGVEQLGEILDRFFGSHVSAVHECAGEIANFAGDAFLAYWAADDGDLGRVTRQAEECARRLHITRWLEPHALPQAPVLHIGLGAGDLWGARLGADRRWHVLLAGAAVRQACAASRRALAGETAVAPEAVAMCAPSYELSAKTTRVSDSSTLAESAVAAPAADAPSTVEALDFTGYVPKRVQEYADEGYSAWIPQRRTVCTLFVRIEGLDETSVDALATHQAVATSIDLALRPYTGSSGRLQLDDKGLVFTLCLGAPHDAHADDSLRAVRAGLAVRRELARLGFGSAMGAADGDGVCMPIGSPQRRLYWVGGSFNHVAARLMEAADDGFLCTERVASQVRHAVSLAPERPLTLKGVRWPVRSFRVQDVGYVDDGGLLYGRDEEQAVLEECLQAFESGRGTVLWMVGEAGLGKTALVRHFQRAVAQRGIPCLTGGAGSVEMAVPYAAWWPVFSALFEGAVTEVERRARVGAIRHPQYAPLVNAVLPGFLDDTPLVQGLSGQARVDATSGVLSDVLALHASGRFVLVLEDCHWMDSASWRLAVRVAQDHPAAVILLTSRPTTDLQELSALRKLERYREMNLSPLQSGAISAMVESVLQGWPAPAELVDEIAERSVGNPLFAREYALLLASRIALSDQRSSVPGAQLPEEPGMVPKTVESLIASRLDALPPAEDLALKAASVIGDTFSVEAIQDVSPGSIASEGGLPSLLVKLAERQLIVRMERGSEAYAFHHQLIREVTYRQLTREQRRELHRRCAERIETRYRSNLSPHAAALAHHWSNAEVPSVAIRYTGQAASLALSAGAFEEAERLLGSCLELAQGETQPIESADLLRWYQQLADARRGMGYLERRKEAAHMALGVAGVSRPNTLLLQASLGALRIGGLCARWVFSAGPSFPPEQTMDVARAFRHSGEVCYFQNDRFGMLYDSLSAATFAAALGPSAVLVGALTELGGIVSVGGLRRTGEKLLHWAIDTAEAANDQAAQAYGHMINCLYYIGQGDWEAAETSCRLCQDLCEPMDDRVNWTNAQAVRFWMSHHRGRVGAEDAARNLLNRATETGNRQHRAWALRCLAVCALREDKFAEALAHLKAAQESLKETVALNERVPTLGLLSLARWRMKRHWPLPEMQDALELLDRIKRPLGYGSLEGYSALATVALEAWDVQRSTRVKHGASDRQDASKKCLQVLRRYSRSFPIGEPRYAMHTGDYWRIAGRAEVARRHYLRGEAAARRLVMPWEIKRCQEALALLEPRSQ